MSEPAEPISIHLPTPPAWAEAPGATAVLDALEAAGSEGRFVGGCVRDSLLGRPIKDIDVATPLEPEAVMAALKQAGLTAVPTGLAHGTVTAVHHHHPIEITTLRHDVETFGRHAKVAFTADWRLDALRRDLTMNALFLDRRGRIYDFVGGTADLQAGRVRFVGDPAQRIEEDYLRILRLLRFQAHYGRTALEEAALGAASRLAPGLQQISGERKRQEMLRLLEAPDPLPVVAVMLERGIMAQVLPEVADTSGLARLLALAPDSTPLQRLASLLPPSAEAALATAQHLKLSNRETKRLAAMATAAADGAPLSDPEERRALLYHRGAEALLDSGRAAAAGGKLGAADLAAIEAEAEAWQPKRLPVGGRDLVPLGLHGPALGRALRALERWWIGEDFAPDRTALLAEAERRFGSP